MSRDREEDDAHETVVRVRKLRVVYRRGLDAFLASLFGEDYRVHWLRLKRRLSWSKLSARCENPLSAEENAGSAVVAVKSISFTVRRNEVFCLAGVNGSGKSSTQLSLAGVLQPSGGVAHVRGFDVTRDIDAVQAVTGVCQQSDVLWATLTADETLRIFAQIKGLPAEDREREIERVLREVRLVSVRSQPVGTYSGGMKRRLSVATAALGSPDVLYLDEPSTGMDPVHRQALVRLIQRLKRSSAIILTTHLLEEADLLADRVAIMVNGRIVALGSPMQLKARYSLGYRVQIVMKEDAEGYSSSLEREGEGKGKGVIGQVGKDAVAQLLLGMKKLAPSC